MGLLRECINIEIALARPDYNLIRTEAAIGLRRVVRSNSMIQRPLPSLK